MSSPGYLWTGTLWAKQMMGRKAVEGGWLTLDYVDWLKFQSCLVVTGAIVIVGMMASPVPPFWSLFKCGPWLLGERQWGEPIVWRRAPLIRGIGFHCRLVNDEHRKGAQGVRYSYSGESPVLELELRLLFLGITP